MKKNRNSRVINGVLKKKKKNPQKLLQYRKKGVSLQSESNKTLFAFHLKYAIKDILWGGVPKFREYLVGLISAG